VEIAAQDIAHVSRHHGGGEAAFTQSMVVVTKASHLTFYKTGPELKGLVEGIRQLKVNARQILQQLEKMELVRTFNPDEVPEVYREEVSIYFQKLSDSK
jgi:hypothetical protein